MQIATTLANEKSFQDAVKRVAELERAGLDFVWVAENSGFDSPSHMGYLAARTERVRIGSGIIPIYTRTPTLIAMTTAGIDSLSGGRFELGLGAGGLRIIEGFHGVSFDSSVGRSARSWISAAGPGHANPRSYMRAGITGFLYHLIGAPVWVSPVR